MKCSHGIPLECKCRSCTDDALKLLRTDLAIPPKTASQAERDTFWSNCYKQSVVPNVY